MSNSNTKIEPPMADEMLIARAREVLEPGAKIGTLFTDNSDAVRTFRAELSGRQRAALENYGRDGR